MASAIFTRDEVILALDVLYSSDKGRVTANFKEIKELSLLLNRLPIHPAENRRADFRNPHGIAMQLVKFRSSCNTGKKDRHVGAIFFDVAFEFENNTDEIHLTAEAIRRNEKAYSLQFGISAENDGFPEGALLSHLHRIIERRDGIKSAMKDYCEVCRSRPAICYQKPEGLLQNHLIIAPVDLDFSKRYNADCFLTVCPTCHEALHRYRPWLTKENCENILR